MGNTQSPAKTGFIVGIGASAGGLEALQKLLTALPPDTGFPYIIVQHLSPDYKSLLCEILSKYTSMPVVQVEDGMDVCPNCVYVIQPGKHMRILGGKLWLSPQRERELNLPIDLFFRSLAIECGSRAIAIVLSGTGSDGSSGIRDVKEHDGMVIVQDLETSKFDGMPRSAMRTGIVDAQISPEEMALELQHISNASVLQCEAPKTESQIDDELMKKIYVIMKRVSNVNFIHYKQTTILRRIERRMMLTRRETLRDYVDFLYESPDEVRTLAKEVLIGVTSFFRDPEFFEALKQKAIREIVQHGNPDEPIRCWVAGCSTGEEAYSIAILFREVMESLGQRREVKIFATDLDVESITQAGKGLYNDNIVDAISPERLGRFFTRKNNMYAVNRDVRKMIVFSPHNVFQDPPFGRLHLVSCRNMLIYFQPVLQNDLFAIFHASLRDDGYLFLGKSESVGGYAEAFPPVDVMAKIFSHNSGVVIAGAKPVPYLQMPDETDEPGRRRAGIYISQKPVGTVDRIEQTSIDISLLEEYMPACIVVNEKNEVIHTYGNHANFIHVPSGRYTNNLYELMTEQLKTPVSTLLKEARDRRQPVQYKDVRFTGERGDMLIDLTAKPISKRVTEQDSLYALIFSEHQSRGALPDAVPYEANTASTRRITDLEQELGSVQGKLDRSVAEQECVNEELQAANEELLTANEELQSSNEELQSVNEELYTVNSEYQSKLTELADLNDDIANFLTCTMTGIIFVDNKLNIRRYTDYVTSEFSVMDHDIGRSLQFISYHFPKLDITQICGGVLKSLVPDEREVITSKGKVFFMRVAPYRSTENRILGCVITLMDITKQTLGQERLEDAEKRLTIAQQSNDAKNDSIGRIAQETRAPLETLLALSRRIRDSHADDADADRLAATAERLSSIIADLTVASAQSCAPSADACAPIPPTAERDERRTDTPAEPEPTDGSRLDGYCLLVAEDNSVNRTILCSMLAKAGASCVECVDGEDALHAFCDHPSGTFDAILMDMRMPKLDGIRATAAIRDSASPDAKHVPIIGVSANAFGDDVKQAFAAGVNDYIPKPINRRKLFAAIRRLAPR